MHSFVLFLNDEPAATAIEHGLIAAGNFGRGRGLEARRDLHQHSSRAGAGRGYGRVGHRRFLNDCVGAWPSIRDTQIVPKDA
jgi:hypothetical protein